MHLPTCMEQHKCQAFYRGEIANQNKSEQKLRAGMEIPFIIFMINL